VDRAARRRLAVLVLVLTGCQARAGSVVESPARSDLARRPARELFAQAAATAAATQPAASQPAVNPDARLAYMLARAAYVRKQPEEAIKCLNEAVGRDPDYAEAYGLLAQLHFERGEAELAAAAARRLLELVPDDYQGNYVLGTILARSGEQDRASRYLYQAIVSAEANGKGASFAVLNARLVLGQYAIQRGWYQAALDLYVPMLRDLEQLDETAAAEGSQLQNIFSSRLPGLYLIVAELCTKLDRYPEARRYFNRAADFPAVKPRAQRGLVGALIRAGRPDEARVLLGKLVAEGSLDETVVEYYRQLYPGNRWTAELLRAYLAQPENPDAGKRLAEELIRAKEWSSAGRALETLAPMAPGDPQVLQMVVTVFGELRRLDRGAELLVSSIASSSTGRVPVPALAEAWEPGTAEQLDRALARLTVPAEKQFARSYLRGLAAEAQGKLPEADEWFAQTCRDRPTFSPAFLARGNILLWQRRWAEAQALAEQALGAFGDLPGFLFVRGVALVERDRTSEGIEVLEQAQRLNPNSGQIRLALAEAYARARRGASLIALVRDMLRSETVRGEYTGELVELLIRTQMGELARLVVDQRRDWFPSQEEYEFLEARLAYEKNHDRAAYVEELMGLAQATNVSPAVLIEQARMAYELNQFSRVVEITGRLLQRVPPLRPGSYERTMTLRALTEQRLLAEADAERDWEALVRSWPERSEFKRSLVAFYFETLQGGKAEPLLKELIDAEKDLAQRSRLQESLVKLYLRLHEFDRARTLVRTLMDQAADDRKVTFQELLIAAYVTARDYDGAVRELARFIQDAPSPELRRKWQGLMISAYLEKGQAMLALIKIEEFEQTAGPDPRETFDGLRLEAMLRLKQFPQAITLAAQRREAAVGPVRVVRTVDLARCYVKAERFRDAERLLEDEMKPLEPASPAFKTLRFHMLRAWKVQGKFAQAELYLQDALKTAATADDREELQQLLVHLYFNWDRPDQAISLLESVLEKDPDQAWAGNSLGYTLADLRREKDYPRAEELIRRALALEPGSSAYLDSLAWVLYRRGRFRDALHYALMAVRSEAGPHPEMLDHLGDIYAALGERSQAEQYWRQAWEDIADLDEIDLEPGLRRRLSEKLGSALPSASSPVK